MGNILRFPRVQPELLAKAPPADMPPALEQVESLLRRAADEIARRGLAGFNIREQDELRLHAWCIRNAIDVGMQPVQYDGRPWRSLFDAPI